jgi:hypothetical protein
VVDREAQDRAGTFGDRIAELRPAAVIDLLCFTAASAQQLVDALRSSRPLLVHCGTKASKAIGSDLRFVVPLARLERATCCLGDDCCSLRFCQVWAGQVGGDSGLCGLVGCSTAWWNDCENDRRPVHREAPWAVLSPMAGEALGPGGGGPGR